MNFLNFEEMFIGIMLLIGIGIVIYISLPRKEDKDEIEGKAAKYKNITIIYDEKKANQQLKLQAHNEALAKKREKHRNIFRICFTLPLAVLTILFIYVPFVSPLLLLPVGKAIIGFLLFTMFMLVAPIMLITLISFGLSFLFFRTKDFERNVEEDLPIKHYEEIVNSSCTVLSTYIEGANLFLEIEDSDHSVRTEEIPIKYEEVTKTDIQNPQFDINEGVLYMPYHIKQ